MNKIEVTCECPKSDITSTTEAFFGIKPGTLSKTPQQTVEEDESDADYSSHALVLGRCYYLSSHQ
jgi:hypothetical protein